MMEAVENYRGRDYWIVENKLYTEPSFRLKKCARIVNDSAAGKKCNLLDVGCGPAALRRLLHPNVEYRGIDIAIQQPATYLREVDFGEKAIGFDQERFDFIVAMGVFEYMGGRQSRKFEEIASILKPNGTFIMSYINFGHVRGLVWPNYNNMQPIAEMAKNLKQVFQLKKSFPASHHWRQKQPGRYALQPLQMHLNFNVPVLSSWFAVEYFFVCTHR